MNLKNEKTKKAYYFWQSMYPASLHPLDTNRFDELALILLENNDEISETEIEHALGDNSEEWIIDTYLTRFNTMSDMYKLMIKSGYTR